MIDDIADAVVNQLNSAAMIAAVAPLTFTATFRDAPKLDPMPQDLTVIVTPNNVLIAPTRSKIPGQPIMERMRGIEQYGGIICVFVAQKGPATSATSPDPIIAWSAARRLLMQQIGKFFNKRPNRVPPGTESKLQTIEFVPLYDLEELMNNRSFLGMLRLSYNEYERP